MLYGVLTVDIDTCLSGAMRWAPRLLEQGSISLMHLVMFDIDGTLTRSCGIDSRCFVDALCEVLGIQSIDTDWSNYRHTTDSGIAQEIITKQLG